MQDERDLSQYNHVIVYIWGSSGGGGRGVGHVAASVHRVDPDYTKKETFVSLWPGYTEDQTLTWQKDFNEIYNAEHDHGPTSVFVFYTLNILKIQARLSTLQFQTESWVMMPSKQESEDPQSVNHNCCTAVWNVLKAGGLCGEADGLLSEKEMKAALSKAKVKLLGQASSQAPQAVTKFFAASSKSQTSRQISMVASGPSTLTWETLLGGERYGPEMIRELLMDAKKKECQNMMAANPKDARLMLRFMGHKNLKRLDGTIDESYQGASTEVTAVEPKASKKANRFAGFK
jgi:hypothetical protein